MVRSALLRFVPVLLPLACGGGLALAPTGPHPIGAQEFVEVEYPPPPAQIEELAEELEGHSECLWIDGHYRWSGRWVWIPGRWVVPPEDCYYAPTVVAWSRTREPKLYYSPPRWYRDDAEFLPANQVLCPMPRTCAGIPSASVGQQ
jgi:hypothetical protein